LDSTLPVPFRALLPASLPRVHETMIKIQCRSGLGNRIKPIASALGLGDVAIAWHPTMHNWIDGREWVSPFVGGFNHYFQNKIPLLKPGPWCNLYDDKHVAPDVDSWRFVTDGPRVDELFEHTPEPYQTYIKAGFRKLEPVPDVLDQVDTFFSQKFRPPVVGVQLRRLYNFQHFSPRNIPIPEDHQILVISDTDEGVAEFIDLYGDRVIWPKKDYNLVYSMLYRTNLRDILLLSRCDHLIITEGSTFGECAWWFSDNKPYTLLKSFKHVCRP
jgi:hypothetical protein